MKRLSKDEWESEIKNQERSGVTVAQYCREKEISEQTFRYHQAKRKSGFIKLGSDASYPIEIEHRSGAIIRIKDVSVAEELLKVL
jgi:hypothetical protein